MNQRDRKEWLDDRQMARREMDRKLAAFPALVEALKDSEYALRIAIKYLHHADEIGIAVKARESIDAALAVVKGE